MTRTFVDGLAAIRSMAAARTDIGEDNCKIRTREAFLVESNGTPTAAASWLAAPDQHRTSSPADAPPFSFGWMTGGGKGAGHVVAIDGLGRLWTPGGPSNADAWYETTAAQLLAGWPNLRWVGWTRSIDGQYPALPPVAPPAPEPPNGKPRPRGPVTRSRALLHRALKRAEANHQTARAAAIRAALRRLKGLGQ
jgi:hypothetical protein